MCTSSLRFKNAYGPIYISNHCVSRMKSRAKLKTKDKRRVFIARAAKHSLLLQQIPKIEGFREFYLYFKRIVANEVKKSRDRDVYFYKNYFLIVTSFGTVVTILNIDKEFNGIFDDIKEAIRCKRENEIVVAV